MKLNEIIRRELSRVGNGATVTSVPKNRRASDISLMKLEREISAQVGENEAMCTKSMLNAAKCR